MDYDCIVFDTAPTGHTLRLLQFPATLEKGLSKLMQLRGTFGGAISQIGSLLGANIDEMQNQLLGRLEELKVSSPPHAVPAAHQQGPMPITAEGYVWVCARGVLLLKPHLKSFWL